MEEYCKESWTWWIEFTWDHKGVGDFKREWTNAELGEGSCQGGW